jgi:hypothetical protein
MCRDHDAVANHMAYNPYLTAWELARAYPPILRAELRSALVPRFSWAIPTETALTAITRYAPIIDVGAGTGYWADLLQRRDADVLPIDCAPPAHTWVPVTVGSGETIVSTCADRTLMLCWPPAASPMAAQTLQHYAGMVVVYIGEPDGGSTGDATFHALLRQEWVVCEQHPLPQWPSARDSLTIYRRRQTR